MHCGDTDIHWGSTSKPVISFNIKYLLSYRDDWEDIKFIEDDKYYDILHVENFQDAKTYKIVDGFKGESALLDIIDIDTEEEALERIEEYKKVWSFELPIES